MTVRREPVRSSVRKMSMYAAKGWITVATGSGGESSGQVVRVQLDNGGITRRHTDHVKPRCGSSQGDGFAEDGDPPPLQPSESLQPGVAPTNSASADPPSAGTSGQCDSAPSVSQSSLQESTLNTLEANNSDSELSEEL
ncbi:hypothetical protein CAPTEDRAFT_206534 [Capitella teleta]|uniref:Uncharacterized protein n=1 Tax=Capitella teleta TaxID=283909 RepID=R7U1S2_CAPTE|nr:hypothetical protein CAPTEDRAFT_206534 [Capitella teleta]|eukprot:ELT99929.1 hypothetical protein CAPTEDRAFT_206534 [Capitella teleta]